MTKIHIMTVMMYSYQSMRMDVTYNFRQPKNPTLNGTLFAFMTTVAMKMGSQRKKINSW
jgi:hypothetical protein